MISRSRKYVSIILSVAILISTMWMGTAITYANTIDFGGLGAQDGQGFKQLGINFKVSGSFESDGTLIYPNDANARTLNATQTVVIKAEGGGNNKHFTFQDLELFDYFRTEELERFDIVLKDINGTTIAEHSLRENIEVPDINGTIMISSFPFTVPFPANGYDNVASIEITYHFDLNDTTPANLTFVSMEVSNFSTVVTAPEINIIGNTNSIANGDNTPSLTDHTIFGSADVSGGTIERTFTIQNLGDGALSLTGAKVTIDGANATDFSVIAQPSATVAVGETSNFVVRFDPGASGNRTATINIENNDNNENPYNFAIQGTGYEPTVTLSVSGTPLAENAGTATISATLSGTYGQAVTVNLGFTGTATGGGTDYSLSANSISIPSGQTTGSVTITSVQDALDEDSETVIVDISSITNGTESGTQQVIATINDDDATPSLSINDPSILEGNAGTSTLQYIVTLSAISGRTVTVDYATADGTATTANSDYSSTSGSLTFMPGQTSKTISVTVNGDGVDEGDQTVLVNLSNPTNATISDAQGSGTITNDDIAGISIDNVTINEGNAGTTTFSFTVSLSIPAGPGGVNFDIATANNTASSGSDYTARSLTAQTIPSGSSTYTFDVLVNGDTAYEGNESFSVNISNVTGATVLDGQGLGTITNDDAAPSVTLGITGSPQAESGGVATVTASLSAISYQDVTINLTYTGSATGAGTDYSVSGNSIIILAGQTTGTVTISGVNDALDEDDETVIVDISSVTNGTESGAQQVTSTIADDDATPSLSINDPSTLEGNAGTSTLQYTVTLSAISGRTVTVDYATANGTATTANSDYSSTSGSLTFMPGQTSKTISVTVNGDGVDEGDQTVLVNLSNPTNATISDAQGSGTITNDDIAGISIDDVTFNEGNAGTTTFSFTVSLSIPAGPGGVTFDIATANNTASSGSDYTTRSLTAQTIPSGSSTYTFDVLVNGDTAYEGSENFSVNISNVTGAYNVDVQGLGTITNDDAEPSVTLDVTGSPQAESGGVATVTASLSAISYQDVTINLTYTGSATGAGTDYSVSGNSITIPAGQTTGFVTITSVNDTTDEVNETVIVDIASVTNGTENGAQQGTTSITDDDAAPGISINNPSVLEGNVGNATLQFTVALSAASEKNITVDYATADGTATIAGNDYSSSVGTLTFAAGQTSKIINVTITGDSVEEASETVLLNLYNAINATIVDAQGSGTITNDEVDLTVPTFSGGGAITVGSVTASTIDLSWSVASDNITLPANLQYKIVRSSSNNLDSVVNAETNGTIVQDWTANITNKQVSGLSSSTVYYFNIIVKDEAGNKTIYTTVSKSTTSPPASSDSTPAPVDSTVIVIVNGKEENAGTETKSQEDGKSVVTVEVKKEVIEGKIDDAIKNNPEGSGNVIQVPIADTTSDVAKVELTGDIIKKLEENTFDVSVKRDDVEYIIPAEEFTISNVAEDLGVSEDDLVEIKIEVKITKLNDSVVAKYNEVAKEKGAELVFPPVEFEIIAKTTHTDGTSSNVEINRFANYVERIMEIPAGVNPNKVTTGIVFNANGTYNHVPTVVFQKDGKWYAQLNSLTNSNYSVIWNPITVASVANHWAKAAVNDLASRLVIDHPKSFDPDKAITRAEFAQYIVKALGLYREDLTINNQFKDVGNSDEMIISIMIANEYGIITGYSDGTFKPDQLITREEAMTMYSRAMKITKLIGTDLERYKSYSDYITVGSWAQRYVKDVLSAHVFNGTTTTTISPKSNLSFAEAAQAIHNLLVESKLINE